MHWGGLRKDRSRVPAPIEEIETKDQSGRLQEQVTLALPVHGS
jgi:hypothetical protein